MAALAVYGPLVRECAHLCMILDLSLAAPILKMSVSPLSIGSLVLTMIVFRRVIQGTQKPEEVFLSLLQRQHVADWLEAAFVCVIFLAISR